MCTGQSLISSRLHWLAAIDAKLYTRTVGITHIVLAALLAAVSIASPPI
jgi:hypothetical protein